VAGSVGILEFSDNAFIRSVATGLGDLPVDFIKAGQIEHPSPSQFRVVIDRVSFCDPFLRQLMRYWSLGGAYILNNPFFTLALDKLSELHLYDLLEIRHPRTILIPSGKPTEDTTELTTAPDWEAVGERVGFPCIIKPVDGYAWQDVFRADDPSTLRGLYESLKSRHTLIVQQLVSYASYYRAFCVGRQEVFLCRWAPLPFDRGTYSLPEPRELDPSLESLIREKTSALNAGLGLDFNAVEWCITPEGVPVVIDSYNDVPDVRPDKLPPACYAWVVDRFCSCVREKAASDERNAPLPAFMSGSQPGAQSR
jgi:hypothetical protein